MIDIGAGIGLNIAFQRSVDMSRFSRFETARPGPTISVELSLRVLSLAHCRIGRPNEM